MQGLVASLRRIGRAIALVLVVQWRTRFPLVYLSLAALTVAALRATPLYEWAEWLLPAVLLGEYGTVSLLLVAAHRYFERNERSATALVVTPIRSGEYALALALGSAIVPTAVGVGVQAGVLGPDGRALALALPLLLTATFSGFVSFALTTWQSEFTRFLMGLFIPATIFLSLPFLSYFEAVPRAALIWIPTDASLFSFAALSDPHPEAATVLGLVVVLCGWNALAFAWARGAMRSDVRAGLEPA